MAKKKILNKKSMDFLEKYLNNAAPTGYEWDGQKLWMDYLKPYVDTFITDTYGSAVGIINPDAPYKVVIEGHSDEISWYVNYITPEGLIYVIRNGGSDHQIAPSKIVNIHSKKGIVKGVFGWPAIHTRKGDKEEIPKLDNIFIDVGCRKKEEVEKLKTQALILSGIALFISMTGALPGICDAVLLSTGVAGATTAAPSNTLPDAAGRRLPK